MLVLAINTASSKTAIALLEKGIKTKLICEDSWQSKNNEAEKLMPNIEKLLKVAKKDWVHLKGVLVIKGPGSFTGLRVGVTVANVIAYLNNTKLYAVDSFEYWWQKFENEKAQEQKKTALLIFAGSKGVYLNFKKSSKVEIVNLDELNELLKSKKIEVAFGDITKEQISELNDVKFKKVAESFGEISAQILNNKLESLETVKPRYIKPPGITPPKCST